MKKIISTVVLVAVLVGGTLLGGLALAGADDGNNSSGKTLSQIKKTIEDMQKQINGLSGRVSPIEYHDNDNDNDNNDDNDNDNNDNDNNDNDNNDDNGDECKEGDEEINTITHTITSADPANSVVIDPVCAKMFVMIFKTESNYDGVAEFQAQLDDGSWVEVGPGQGPDETQINGMDSFGAADFKLPLTVRVVVINQATAGGSLAQLDFLGGEDDDDDNDNDNDDD